MKSRRRLRLCTLNRAVFRLRALNRAVPRRPEALTKWRDVVNMNKEQKRKVEHTMKRIKTIETRNLKESLKDGGCGECQTSCQSACKTSCGIANQKCEKAE